jgi:hypothetical protein
MTSKLSKDELLIQEVENEILSVADLSDDVTRSDLQGIASVTARKIIAMVRKQAEPSSK